MIAFNPIQTNAMPVKEKLKNMVWQIVNKVFFRLTPPVNYF